MILKTAANYNDEGGYIEAWKNSDGTTEIKLIPKSDEDEGKHGLKSITISPAITTTPALDSVHVYWEDLTEEQKSSGVRLDLNCPNQLLTQDYAVTLTPTAGWAIDTGDEQVAGEPVTVTLTCSEFGGARFVLLSDIPIINTTDEEEVFSVTVSFADNDPK